MSAYVRIPTAMTDREVLLEAIRICRHSIQVTGSTIVVSDIIVYGYPLTFEPSSRGYIAAGMDLRISQQTQQQLARINNAYNTIVSERIRVAAEAERQRILEEQQKLVEQRTEALLAEAKLRNFRVKEEIVNGKKRFTLVKMIIQ
jgi:spore germination protein YaaH